MSVRFSTEAANADKLNDGDKTDGASDESPEIGGSNGTSRGQAGRENRDGEAKPGKDINAAGFVRDKDAGKP